MAAGKIPRMPPPSMDRMRKRRFFGQACGIRVAESLPLSAALRVQVFFLQTWLRNLRVPTATFPFATCDQFFMEEEPFDNRRYIRSGASHPRWDHRRKDAGIPADDRDDRHAAVVRPCPAGPDRWADR